MTKAFITGAATGIGRACAIAVARDGGAVAGTFWGDDASIAEFQNYLVDLGGSAVFANIDVRDTAGLEEFASTAIHGMDGLDLWVNCAARLLSRPFLDTSDEDWLDILDSNLLGYVRGSRIAARALGAGGSIVNISSITSTQPPGNLSAYVTAKGGVDALTRSLAVELAPLGIRVNGVAPGAIDTPLNLESWSETVHETYIARAAMKRLGAPEEIAALVLLLASPGASFVTGEIITADGGLLIDGTVGHEAT